jgi:hypothetical protein
MRKGNMDPRDRELFDASTQKPRYHDHKPHRQEYAPQQSQNKNTCKYYGNNEHVEKTYMGDLPSPMIRLLEQHPRVLVNLFSNSKKWKILSSELVSFTLGKYF